MSFNSALQTVLAGTRLFCDTLNLLDASRKTFERAENPTISKVCTIGLSALCITNAFDEMKAKLLNYKSEDLVSLKKQECFFRVSTIFVKLFECSYNRLKNNPLDYTLTRFTQHLLSVFRASEELKMYEMLSLLEVEKGEEGADVDEFKAKLKSSQINAITLGSIEVTLEGNHFKKLYEFDEKTATCIPPEYHNDIIFSRYVCPLSHKPIRFIVGDPDGIHYYEKEEIINWIRNEIFSPGSGRPLEEADLKKLPELQSLIDKRLTCLRGRL